MGSKVRYQINSIENKVAGTKIQLLIILFDLFFPLQLDRHICVMPINMKWLSWWQHCSYPPTPTDTSLAFSYITASKNSRMHQNRTLTESVNDRISDELSHSFIHQLLCLGLRNIFVVMWITWLAGREICPSSRGNMKGPFWTKDSQIVMQCMISRFQHPCVFWSFDVWR